MLQTTDWSEKHFQMDIRLHRGDEVRVNFVLSLKNWAGTGTGGIYVISKRSQEIISFNRYGYVY